MLIWKILKEDGLTQADFGAPEELLQLEEVNSCAVSEDGKYVATSSRMTSVWKRGADGYSSSSVVAQIPLRSSSLVFSANGEKLFTLSDTPEGRTGFEAWDLADFSSSAEMTMPMPVTPASTAVPVNPESGRTLRPAQGYAVDQSGRRLSILELKTGRETTPVAIKDLEGVNSFKVSDDGRYIAVGVDKGEEYVDENWPHDLLLWDVSHARQVGLLHAGAWIKAYEFSPRGTYLAVGDRSGGVQIFSLLNGALSTVRHYSSIDAIAFSADESHLATGDASGLVIISDLLRHEEVAHLKGTEAQGFVFSQDGRYLTVGQSAWLLRLRDLIDAVCQRMSRFSGGKSVPYCPRPT